MGCALTPKDSSTTCVLVSNVQFQEFIQDWVEIDNEIFAQNQVGNKSSNSNTSPSRSPPIRYCSRFLNKYLNFVAFFYKTMSSYIPSLYFITLACTVPYSFDTYLMSSQVWTNPTQTIDHSKVNLEYLLDINTFLLFLD